MSVVDREAEAEVAAAAAAAAAAVDAPDNMFASAARARKARARATAWKEVSFDRGSLAARAAPLPLRAMPPLAPMVYNNLAARSLLGARAYWAPFGAVGTEPLDEGDGRDGGDAPAMLRRTTHGAAARAALGGFDVVIALAEPDDDDSDGAAARRGVAAALERGLGWRDGALQQLHRTPPTLATDRDHHAAAADAAWDAARRPSSRSERCNALDAALHAHARELFALDIEVFTHPAASRALWQWGDDSGGEHAARPPPPRAASACGGESAGSSTRGGRPARPATGTSNACRRATAVARLSSAAGSRW